MLQKVSAYSAALSAATGWTLLTHSFCPDLQLKLPGMGRKKFVVVSYFPVGLSLICSHQNTYFCYYFILAGLSSEFLKFCAKFGTHALFCPGHHGYSAHHRHFCLLVMIASYWMPAVRYRCYMTYRNMSGHAQNREVDSRYFLIRPCVSYGTQHMLFNAPTSLIHANVGLTCVWQVMLLIYCTYCGYHQYIA
jgi:hypothetical protein